MQTVYVFIGCYEIHINVKSECVQKITLSSLYNSTELFLPQLQVLICCLFYGIIKAT